MSDINHPNKHYLPALFEPTDAREDERLISVTIITRERDREGDLVEPAGLDFEHYLKNPVVLWAHDLTRAPVGRVLSIYVLPERVDAEVQFADTVEGRECFQLYRDRYLNAWSIGFLSRRWQPLAESGFHIQEAEVVELSAVPMPCYFAGGEGK
jgi:HK97 family phage prohead protease